MTDVMTQAFWATATHLVDLIVPIIVIMIIMRLIVDVLFGRK